MGKKKIFVIGYPKSGNTWLARLLATSLNCEILRDENENSEVNTRVDDLRHSDLQENEKYLIIKRHFTDPYVHMPKETTIYIIRNPYDNLLSCYDYCLPFKRNSILAKIYTFLFKNIRLNELQKEWGRGKVEKILIRLIKKPWKFPSHANNWKRHVDYYVPRASIVVRYEDLLAHPEDELKRILDNLTGDDSKSINLEQVVGRNSIKYLKNMQETKRDRRWKKFASFINSEVPRRGKETLPAIISKRISIEYSEELKRFRYE